MRRARLVLRPLLGPVALCAVGLGFVARVGWRAIQLDPLPAARASSVVAGAVSATRSSAQVDLTPAVELDPFRPDRRRPPARYPVPGDAPPPSEKPPVTTPNVMTLVGTVMSLDGSSFAMVGVAGSPPRVVRVGQTIGDLTLKKIEQGRAVFRSAEGEVIELTVPKASQ